MTKFSSTASALRFTTASALRCPKTTPRCVDGSTRRPATLSRRSVVQGAETSRVLELWEDTKGPRKGIKYFRGRWLFYPHHLSEDHKEAKRKRTGLELRQVYEQCDAAANNEENPLASVRSVQRVLCCWKDARNRMPSDEERQSAHAWFDSAWDNVRLEVVPLSACVDKPGSGACRRAAARCTRFDAACFRSTLCAHPCSRNRPAAHACSSPGRGCWWRAHSRRRGCFQGS